MPFYSQIPIIAVVGSRHSGKTATVETIVKGLTQKGYKIATAKHIHQKNFTIDTPGRDTWKHTQAGAHITIAVAANELTTIKKTNTTKLTINDITKACQNNTTDVIILEGFRELIAQNLLVPKIVTVRNMREINEANKTFKPILTYATLTPETKFTKPTNPPIHITNEPQKLIQIIDKRIGPIIAKNRETKDSTTIEINQQHIPLNPYVQKVTRNVLLSIISTLKGTKIKGNENIKITITNQPKHPNHKK